MKTKAHREADIESALFDLPLTNMHPSTFTECVRIKFVT